MNRIAKPLAIALTIALGTSALAPIAMADQSQPTASTTSSTNSQIALSGQGRMVMSVVHNARLALFDGQVDAAKDMLNSASALLDEDAAKAAIKLSDGKGFALPVDGSASFADDFEPTAEHAKVIEKAGMHMQQGDVDGAINMMKEAGISLYHKVLALPVTSTAQGLKQALTDIEAGHVHKANMALKTIETSLAEETYASGDMPKQGYPLSEVL